MIGLLIWYNSSALLLFLDLSQTIPFMKAEKRVKIFFLQKAKPEFLITAIFSSIVILLGGLLVYDYFQKKRINDALNSAKNLIAEVALSLTTENITAPVKISPQYLDEKIPFIEGVSIYPDNHLEIIFNKTFIDNSEKKFTFSFNSIDELSRGYLTCESGDVRLQILPNQCRR